MQKEYLNLQTVTKKPIIARPVITLETKKPLGINVESGHSVERDKII